MDAAGSSLLMAGATTQATGDIQQGYAASAAAGYNAQVAEQNAQLATQNAEWTGAEGEQAYGLQGLKTKEQVGTIKASQAANNVDIGSGSAKAVQESQAIMGKLSEANIRSNAARQAYGFETASSQYTGQSALYKNEAKQDITAGYTRATADLLTGAGHAALYSSGSGKIPSITDDVDFAQGSAGGTGKSSFLGEIPSDNFNLWQSDNANLFGGL